MTTNGTDTLAPAAVQPISNRQGLFLRYFTAILIDLVVINLFVEYSDQVVIDSFTVTILAAALLQVLLKLTIAFEHKLADFWNARTGGFSRFMRFFTAWLVLFGSKFVILEAINIAFGDRIEFVGRFDGLLVLIAVILSMLLAEDLMVRFYRRLA
jgi:hypothetical protein